MIYNNSIEYPTLSPIRWVNPVSDAYYLRKMGRTDTWRVQFLSDSDHTETFILSAYEQKYGFFLCDFTFTKKTLSTGKYYWDAYVSASTITTALAAFKVAPYNMYYLSSIVTFKLRVGTTVWADSLPVHIGSFSDTKQISVWNTSPDHGVIFGDINNDGLFSFRVEARFESGCYELKGEYETFEDQIHQPIVTYSSQSGVLTLTIGDITGFSDDMAAQIQYFLACDTLLIDNKHYVRGEITEEKNEKRGMRQMMVELMTATNWSTQNIVGEETVLVNEEGNIITNEEFEALAI